MNNEIFQHFHGYELLLKKIDNLIFNYQNYCQETVSDFYNPDALEVIQRYLSESCDYHFFGGYAQAIRKVLIIGNDINDREVLTCLEADFNRRFNILDNRDVKGAVYNLGIDIGKIGDFWVEDEKIFLYCRNEIADYLIDNFKQIGKCNISFRRVEFHKQTFKFDNFNVTVNSTRLDSIVGAIIHKSREKSKERINAGLVNVNFRQIDQCDYLCKAEDVLSIKKVGRYRIKDIQKNIKSGKIILSIDKYI